MTLPINKDSFRGVMTPHINKDSFRSFQIQDKEINCSQLADDTTIFKKIIMKSGKLLSVLMPLKPEVKWLAS